MKEFFLKALEKLQDHNSEAYKACKNNLLELESIIEILNKAYINRRSYDDYRKAIFAMENVLKKLQEYLEDLSFGSLELNKKISESLKLINRMNRHPMNAENNPSFIAVDILMLWGKDLGREYKINELKKELKNKMTVFTVLILISYGVISYYQFFQQRNVVEKLKIDLQQQIISLKQDIYDLKNRIDI